MKLFIGAVKYEKKPRERKWTVRRCVIMAPDEAHAMALLKERAEETRSYSNVPLHYKVRPAESDLIDRDSYLAADGDPFPDRTPFMENPIFGE